MQNSNDSQSRTFLTVSQFASKHPAFSEASLRWIIFNAKERRGSQGAVLSNGFETAIIRLGRKVLIDEQRFFEILSAGQSHHRRDHG
jgi:hypothetical protein